jgi:pyrroline-5-carboxylate reductase
MGKNIIGIIGGGNMGEALIKGVGTSKVLVSERDSKRKLYLKNKYHVDFTFPIVAAKQADIIILAVKPQDMDIVLYDIKRGMVGRSNGLLLISIAAGLTTAFFEKYLGNKIRVVRAMPNMTALIGEGITGISAGRYATTADIKEAQKILQTIGQTVIVKESMMDSVTAVSGSGPAYVFLFVEQWINAAVKLGFNKLQARQLVYKTLLGSAHLLEQSSFDAATLRAKVTSKGGTTQAAMDAFAKGKFDQLMKDALTAAKKRAKELAK